MDSIVSKAATEQNNSFTLDFFSEICYTGCVSKCRVLNDDID
jgi:hypothetical protein